MIKITLALLLAVLSLPAFSQSLSDEKTAAELVFLFTPEGKKYVLEEGSVNVNDFSHSNPNALVINQSTQLDISAVDRFENVKSKCFLGASEDARSIVTNLILNADGNGDSWLESVSVLATERKVNAEYTLVTEAGEKFHEFEIESCEALKKPSIKDPVFGKYNMCVEDVVQLPEHVYIDLKRISESQNMESMKLDLVKSLFRGVALNKSMKNYCTVVSQVMDTDIETCQKALRNENLSNPQILQLTKTMPSSEEVLCSLAAMIALIISPL